MREELFVSGRNIPHIDPVLEVWHWPIPAYLFLGGLAAGILFFASLYTILGKEDKYPTAVKRAPFIAPIAIMIGLFFLVIDLKHMLYFWQLYLSFRITSPMSWGAWTLLLITPISIVWCASFIKELYPNWDWKYPILNKLEAFVIKNRKSLAWIQIVLAVILGIYTGILLSAFNARPLWSTSILGPLFLTSGLSTGAAAIIWMSRDKQERKVFSRIDMLLIIIEIVLITHMFMGFLASNAAQVESVKLFMGGEFTAVFWVFVMGLGLIIPLILEAIELKGVHIPAYIPAILVIIGGLLFRFIMVEAGQVTRYLY